MPLRLVSFLSSLGCFLNIFLLVKKETTNPYAGILASGLFAATYRISGAWFDIARIDSLFLLLCLWAIYLIRFTTSFLSYIAAGILFSLSFLTKQTTLIIAAPIMLYCIWVNWRRALVLISTMIISIVGSILVLDYIHDGWYMYYVFGLLQKRQPIIISMLVSFWSRDILFPVGIAFCMSLFYLLVRFATAKKCSVFYSLVTVGMFGGAWIARFKAGGYNNNLITAYAVVAILFGLAVHTLFEFIRKLPNNQQGVAKIYVYVICILQFGALIYNPFKEIPTQQDLDAGKQFVSELAQIKGDIFLLRHGYLLHAAGKRSFAQEMAIHDVLTGDPGNIKVTFAHEIREAIAEKRFGAIIIDGGWWFSNDVEKYYEKQRRVFNNETVFWPVTGHRTRPEIIYSPKSERL